MNRDQDHDPESATAPAPPSASPPVPAPTPGPALSPAPGFAPAPAPATPEAPTVIQPDDSLPGLAFDELPERLRQAARRMGWSTLMPVQSLAIPYLLAGRDIMVQSRTGSGKTGAFVLPILERTDTALAACQALVLVPTRELARQDASAAEAMATGTGVRVAAVYGGVGYGAQLAALREGAHLVVGTPGRILDHLMRGSLRLDRLRILVFDEADRMLSVGFYPDIVAMAEYLPDARDGFMFSATYPPSVLSLAGEFLRHPEFLSLSRGAEHVPETEHLAYEVPAMEKTRALVRIIEIENPDAGLIFCNTRDEVRYVATVLKNFGYDADPLSSDLAQPERDKVLARVYQQKLRFLVATDVAARGIDIPHLSHVVLYDFPEDPESYIHRAGRTGRAGASGMAISLVDVLEKMQLADVVRRYGIDLQWRTVPTPEEVEAVVAERVTALLEAKLRKLTPLVRERMRRMMPLARRLGETDDELAVIAMLLDEHYQKVLHSAPELPGPAGVGEEEEEKAAAPAGAARTRPKGRPRRGGRRRRSSGGRGEGGRGQSGQGGQGSGKQEG